MRYIDLYKQTAGGAVFITGGCIQTGEPAVQRAPIVKSYTMADGTPLVYPSAKDTCTASIELECTMQEAAAIEPVVRRAQIILAGIKAGSLLGDTQLRASDLPLQTGVPCIITGAVDICEKYAKSGIYGVTLPLQIEVADTGLPQSVPVPVVRVPMLTLDSVSEGLGRYTAQKLLWGGKRVLFLVRKPYFTKQDSLTLGVVATGEPAECYLYVNGEILDETPDTVHTFTVPLHVGNNEIVLEWIGADCRPMRIRLDVYRQNVG